MMNLIRISICLLASFIPSKKALHMFQQNRYELYRYSKWLFRKVNFDFKLVLFVLVNLLLAFIDKPYFYESGLVLLLIISYVNIKAELKHEYIKKLVITARVKRQIFVLIILLVLLFFFFDKLALIGSLIYPMFLIYPMALLTAPFEKAIKKHYEHLAQNILQSLPLLTKIGITGSFGKTSVKNIIFDLLSENKIVLKTPASYNTPMGITKTIRESLKPTHEIFVCEMGADHVGEITYLMNFVKPQIGIVTSIGPQHLNTFGSLDKIIKEKMQMIECLPTNGLGIINVDNPYIANYKIKNKCSIIRVGMHNSNADLVAKDLKYSVDGSQFKVNLRGEDITFNIPLLGEHNVMNCLLAIALADYLGLKKKEIVNYCQNIKPIEHRLEKKIINGYHFIDNAFNSNPVGCKLSLDVLSKMPGKRVIVTPGLIDLGKEEFKANKEFGRYMYQKCDFVIIVGELEKNALLEGLKEGGFSNENIICVGNERSAFNYIYEHFTVADTILLENDLPDAFLK